MKIKTFREMMFAGNLHVRFCKGSHETMLKRMSSLLKRFLLVVLGLVALLLFSESRAAEVRIPEDGTAVARELLPKVWVPDPEGASRESADIGDFGNWYDPSKNPAFMIPMFKTAAVWNAPELGDVVLRILDDDEAPLMDQKGFIRNVKRVLGMGVSVFVNKNKRAEPKMTLLSGIGGTTNNAVSIHVKIDNVYQFTVDSNCELFSKYPNRDSVLLSKRYLNVDGRFFYIAVRTRLFGKNVFACAKANENFLNAWERDIRRCTAEHRLAEHGGDAKAAENTIVQELLADKTKLQNSSKYGPTFDERLESALAERGYNSTNKPSPEVRKEIVKKLWDEDAKRMLDRIDADKNRDKVAASSIKSQSMDGNASKGRRIRVLVVCVVIIILIFFVCVLMDEAISACAGNKDNKITKEKLGKLLHGFMGPQVKWHDSHGWYAQIKLPVAGFKGMKVVNREQKGDRAVFTLSQEGADATTTLIVNFVLSDKDNGRHQQLEIVGFTPWEPNQLKVKDGQFMQAVKLCSNVTTHIVPHVNLTVGEETGWFFAKRGIEDPGTLPEEWLVNHWLKPSFGAIVTAFARIAMMHGSAA